MKKPFSIRILIIAVFIYFFSITLWTVSSQIQIYKRFIGTHFFVRNLLTAVPVQLLIILLPSIVILFAIRWKSRNLKWAFLIIQIIQFLIYLPFFVILVLLAVQNMSDTESLYYIPKAFQRCVISFLSFYLPGILYTVLTFNSNSLNYFRKDTAFGNVS